MGKKGDIGLAEGPGFEGTFVHVKKVMENTLYSDIMPVYSR